jgi:DNA-binding MarR family transcriptional regulator
VSGKLRKESHQSKAIRLLEEETTLNIMRTADHINLQLLDVLKPHGLSGTQYNVLRILRGAGETGASCKDVAGRLVTRDPDITRLMDRLEKRGILTRDRAKQDRRVVTHRLTEAGLELVNLLDRPIKEMHQRTMQPLKPGQLRDLIGLLEELRA